jgi:tetratricopeptide (TPR) repeat protein
VSRTGQLIAASILVLGLSVLYPMQRWIDRTSPPETAAEERLFLSGATIKKMSFGLEALAADVYWIRTVQYFGRKLIDSDKPLSSATTKDIRMDLLAPLLNIVVTLDPQHLPAYRFGAIFLPERDRQAAIDLVEKGIRENPNEWRLYQDLAYIYWQTGNTSTEKEQAEDYAKAAYWYERGANVPGAPWWMHDLSGLMNIKGKSRETARAVYSSYLSSDDPNIRAQAIDRLKQIRAFEELDAINALLSQYKQQTGECPPDLGVLALRLRAMKLTIDDDSNPVDPDGFAYAYDRAKCHAAIALKSTVSR